MRYWKSLAKRAAYSAKANRNFSSQTSSTYQDPVGNQDLQKKHLTKGNSIPFQDIQIGQLFYFGRRNTYKFEKINNKEAICLNSSGVKIPHPFDSDTPVVLIKSKFDQSSSSTSIFSNLKTQTTVREKYQELEQIEQGLNDLEEEFDELGKLLDDELLKVEKKSNNVERSSINVEQSLKVQSFWIFGD